jgi:hypothetical protein
MRKTPSWMPWPWLLAAGACNGVPATPEQVTQLERHMLQPFLTDAEVGCGELLIEITGNFHPNVSQPSEDPNLHGRRREQHADYTDTVWTNKVGDLGGAFVVTVGDTDRFTEQGIVRGRHTKFTVLHEVRLRVWQTKRPITLVVEARGRPLVRKEAGLVRDLGEFRVEDGSLRAQ